jgi:hypothetical protein
MTTPLSNSEIRTIEQHVGVVLPADFVHVLQYYHGAIPMPHDFTYIDEDGDTCVGGIAELLSGDLQRPYNIVAKNQRPPEELPAGLVIVGQDGGGGMVCFDYRQTPDAPPVVFWSNDTISADTAIYLAPTFSAFLAGLHTTDPLPE